MIKVMSAPAARVACPALMPVLLAAILAMLIAGPAEAAKPDGKKQQARTAKQAAKTKARKAEASGGGQLIMLAGGAVAVVLLAGGAAVRRHRRRSAAARHQMDRAQERSEETIASENRVRALITGSADIIAVIGRDSRIVAHPETVERALDLTPGALGNRPLTSFLTPGEAERTLAALASLQDKPGGTKTLEWTLHRHGGAIRYAEALVTNHCDDPRLRGFVLNVRDVTERRLLELELRHRAFHDDLTGLANRALLEDRLRHVIARGARTLELHAVIFLDLDDFQGIVDAHGDAVGDELLVNVGRRLQAKLRANDTLARLHGDVFAILLEDVPNASDAVLAARRLIDALREPFIIAGHDLVVGASAGVEVGDGSAGCSHEETATRELLHADVAMRAARRVGSGSVERYASEMHEAVAQRVELRAQIRAGIRRGQFRVHYQPIVDLSTGRPVGFEALARWEHPTRGLISPAEFIPVAEQTGLILDLGNYILRDACAQLAAWNAVDDSPRYVSVNVAGLQLHSDAFVDKVAAILRGTGLPPEQLLLEVTETALVQDADGCKGRLQALRDLGVRLAVDDFGTGYSSLNYLRRFPMDVLKIDKSFVDGVAENPDDNALVEAIVTLGRALGLTVVAEGIEERAQADALLALGCPLGQGYLFSRPLPAGEAGVLTGAASAIAA